MLSATEALECLRQGNGRFVSGHGTREISAENSRRKALLDEQHPFAIVLGCSDSRVPLELVFDQGLGDLFVIRVAGNIVMPSQIGSVEFAAEKFGTRLVVVLGHSQCGAVLATLDELEKPTETRSPNLGHIVDAIRPSVEELFRFHQGGDREVLAQEAVRANVRNSLQRLHHGSEIIENLVENGLLLIVGAEYSLETGVVEFFEDPRS